MLGMTASIHHTSQIFVVDSGFCVLKGLVQLAKKGAFGSEVIKKRRYWPKYIEGNKVKEHFDNQPIGSQEALSGCLHSIPFNLFGLKEENYTTVLMSTYGTTEEMSEAH